MHRTRLAMEGKAYTRNVWILMTIFFLVKVQGDQDPCNSYQFLNDTTMLTSYTNNTTNCTRQSFQGWYRFAGNPDGLLSDVCPQDSQCGTTNKRIWMDGTIPSILDNITAVPICMTGQGNCCGRGSTIEIKNCTDFIVINLSYQQPCIRLCFPISEASNTTEISAPQETLAATSTTQTKAPTTSSLTATSPTISPTESTTALEPSATPTSASSTNETFTTSEPLTMTTAHSSSFAVLPEVVYTIESVLFFYLCCSS